MFALSYVYVSTWLLVYICIIHGYTCLPNTIGTTRVYDVYVRTSTLRIWLIFGGIVFVKFQVGNTCSVYYTMAIIVTMICKYVNKCIMSTD